jgi:ribosomal protein S18 acetylase RimI-like enzyme
MITVRSIRPDEADRFAALGHAPVRDALRAAWDDGSGRPDWTLLAEADGRPMARAALLAEPMGGGIETLEGVVAFPWVDADQPRHPEAFQLLMDALAERLAPLGPTTLDRRLNPETHADIDRMRPLLEASGFELFQEKAGFAWRPEAAIPATPVRLRISTLDEVGRDAYRRVMAATTAGTLDRNDRYYIDRCRPAPWAEQIMAALEPGDETSWLLGSHGEEPAGFVAVGSFDEETWTIVHIGVVPEHRGHGHVSELLAAADRAARERGFAAGLSDVDVENAPMIAAMERAGHRSDLRPWHVWHYRRQVP